MAKKRFYGTPVIVGASAVSVKVPAFSNISTAAIPDGGVGVSLGQLKNGQMEAGASDYPSLIPDGEVARIASIIVPAGVHAIIDFIDGRQFVCYCADKPVKVKPSILAPAHAWRSMDDTTVLFKLTVCDAAGTAFVGSGTTVVNQYNRTAKSIQVNVAVRSY